MFKNPERTKVAVAVLIKKKWFILQQYRDHTFHAPSGIFDDQTPRPLS